MQDNKDDVHHSGKSFRFCGVLFYMILNIICWKEKKEIKEKMPGSYLVFS